MGKKIKKKSTASKVVDYIKKKRKPKSKSGRVAGARG